ncbi:MAG: transposase [Bacteroidia bacterium]
MSSAYKFYNPDGIFFVSTSVVFWMDVFVRRIYKEIFTESLIHCIQHKGLVVHAWVLMPSHFHLIISRNGEDELEAIMRDFKKFTSTQITEAIKNNVQESRRELMMNAFKKAGAANANNKIYPRLTSRAGILAARQSSHSIEYKQNEGPAIELHSLQPS